MLQLDQIDPKVLGQRLADARKARGITQEAAGEHIGCSRPTLIAIEKGSRPPKADELIRLAALYIRPVHELVRPGEPVADLQPHLRAVAERMKAHDEEGLTLAIGELQRFAEDYRELERIMNAPLRYNYPAEVSLHARIDPSDQAEAIASQERQRLGLGDQPILRLRDTLEMDVGVRIFLGNLPSAVAGMYAFVSDLGACIYVNRKHPPERKRASMAHEYGHLIADRYTPGIDYLSFQGRKPVNERFAESFGMSFLMPATSLRRHFSEIVSTTNDFRVADLCRLSHHYFVSVEAMSYRLEGLGLIPKGTVEHLRESGFAVRKATAMLELPSQTEPSELYPERYKFLAVQAYEQAKLSEGQLARFLRCDRVAARQIVADCLTTDDVTADGDIGTMQLDFQYSLFGEAK